MDYNDFENFGQQINNKVRDAIDSFDFEKLNQDIRSTADDVISGVRRTIKGDYGKDGWKVNDRGDGTYRQQGRQNQHAYGQGRRTYDQNRRTYGQGPEGAESYGPEGPDMSGGREQPNYWNPFDLQKNRSRGRERERTQNFYEPRHVKPTTAVRPVMEDYGFPVVRSPKGELSGLLLTTFGSIGFSLFSLFYLCLGAFSIMEPGSWLYSAAVAFGLMPFEIGFLAMIVTGTSLRNRVKRFRKYIKSMKGKSFAAFKDFAAIVGKSKKFVARDVQKMIALGYFPEGHIDSQQTCLMVTDDIYGQYQKAMESMQAREVEDMTRESAPEASDSDKKAVDQLDELRRQYMDKIRRANDEIPDTEISNKLYRMELVIGKIFDEVKRHPEKSGRLSQFQNYYMPMTIKLVETYRDIDKQPIQGENIKKVKQDIEGTLDTINEAYEKLYDSMYKETVMDVSSDISVLQTLLAQEGLTKGAFDKKK